MFHVDKTHSCISQFEDRAQGIFNSELYESWKHKTKPLCETIIRHFQKKSYNAQ